MFISRSTTKVLGLLLVSVLTSSYANSSDIPTNSIDLAQWAQQANNNSLRRLNTASPQPYSAIQVSYNPYAAMSSQPSYTPSAATPLSGTPRGTLALKSPSSYSVGAANFTCVRQAAFDQQVPLRFMLAINSIERGRYDQKVANSNKTYDMGQFQINTIHLGAFAKFGASEYDINNRGCYNAQAAARLLSLALREPTKVHMDIFTRAAGYHSWTPQYNTIYRTKLIRYLREWDNWIRVNNIPMDIRTT